MLNFKTTFQKFLKDKHNCISYARKKPTSTNINISFNNITTNSKILNNTESSTLLLKKNLNFLNYIKTAHSYHLVDPSPWPFIAAFGSFTLLSGAVLFMQRFYGGFNLLITGFISILFVMYVW